MLQFTFYEQKLFFNKTKANRKQIKYATKQINIQINPEIYS